MSATSSHRPTRADRHLVTRGTTTFAGVMLITVATFQILEGIAAIAEDSVFVPASSTPTSST